MMILNSKTGEYEAPDKTAESFFTAESYFNAVNTLFDAYILKDDIHWTPLGALPLYQNMNHLLELILKAYLLLAGMDSSELKKPHIRHDLRELLKQCDAKGIALNDDFKLMASQEHWMHVSHQMRYYDSKKLYFFSNPENVVPTIRNQFEKLRNEFRQTRGWNNATN